MTLSEMFERLGQIKGTTGDDPVVLQLNGEEYVGVRHVFRDENTIVFSNDEVCGDDDE